MCPPTPSLFGVDSLPAQNYKEDTRVDRTQVVTMAVMDGIQLGHKVGNVQSDSNGLLIQDHVEQKCAVPSCKLEPVDHRSERFCTEHAHYRALCGVVGCGKLVKKTAAGEKRSGACEGEEHQALWTQHEKRQIGGRVKGFSRIIRRRKRKREGLRQSPAPSLGSDFEHDASDFDQLDSDAEDESDQPDSDDGSEYKPALAPKRAPLTMWSFDRTAAVQILVHACGCPIAWRKLVSHRDLGLSISRVAESSVYSMSQKTSSKRWTFYVPSKRLLLAVYRPSSHTIDPVIF